MAHDLVTMSPRPDVLECAVTRHADAAREAVAETLLMSGLVVSRGKGLVFRHRTIEEYLAACHVLATHPDPVKLLEPGQREWPDHGMKVFLAAQLIQSGTDIRRQLNRTTWPLLRAWHLGFVPALVRHGANVDDKVLRRTVRVLSRIVRVPSTGKEWLQHVQWLHEIDHVATADVLRSMIAQKEKFDANRLFEAVRYLIGMDAHASLRDILAYLSSPDIRKIDRTGVAKALHETDPELNIRIFTELATVPELQASAISITTAHDPAAGFALWSRKALHSSEKSPGEQQHEFAVYLVDQAGHDPAILLDTARRRDVPERSRVLAALRNHVEQPQRSMEVLEDVIECQRGLTSIRYLRMISESCGVAALVSAALDSREADNFRLTMAKELPGPEALDVYDRLIDDRSFGSGSKLEVARLLHLSHPARGHNAFERIADQSHIDAGIRLKALRSNDHEACYRACEEIVHDRGVALPVRVRAAIKARFSLPDKKNALLEILLREECGDAVEPSFDKLLYFGDSGRRLRKVVRSTLPVTYRLAAAELLPTTDAGQADAYRAIADDTQLDDRVREEARREIYRTLWG
ncbi:hypothetical protein [Nocardia sp. NRRL S-836]|uniref:hypothetical protein n=1 Tax=Nocardia sp. NRRL S-836 TaxID=1519492 RepID=UPI0006AF69A0|nr:hypothetical protein [Nocardia sp. NRRL S-836]KOV87564.1 hypothetical protein ADL03_06605 [Nocardia sp. NRRL S-836]